MRGCRGFERPSGPPGDRALPSAGQLILCEVRNYYANTKNRTGEGAVLLFQNDVLSPDQPIAAV